MLVWRAVLENAGTWRWLSLSNSHGMILFTSSPYASVLVASYHCTCVEAIPSVYEPVGACFLVRRRRLSLEDTVSPELPVWGISRKPHKVLACSNRHHSLTKSSRRFSSLFRMSTFLLRRREGSSLTETQSCLRPR